MRTSTRPGQGGGKGLRRLADAVGWRNPDPSQSAVDAGVIPREPMEGWVRIIFQSLAVYRLVSFAMGVGLIFLQNRSDQPSTGLGIMIIVVGLYTVYRVARRFDPSSHNAVTQWTALGVDVALGVNLVIMSGGLDSPFLIYSLSPILTASLLMDVGSAAAVAGISALSVSGPHVAGGLGITDFPSVISGNYLAFALLYAAVCLLIANLPFLANLNWQRRVRTESLASERNRLRRDVHDNVGQTLAFLSLKMKRAEQRASQNKIAITVPDVAEIGSVVEKTYLAVRDYLDGTEDAEASGDLGPRLADVVDQWRRDTGLAVNMSSTGEEGELPATAKFHLLQVAREALANVAKHAYPTNVWVDLK